MPVIHVVCRSVMACMCDERYPEQHVPGQTEGGQADQGGVVRRDIPSQIEYDELHLNAVLNWIEGNYANGTFAGGPFNLFGSTFQVHGA